jgi:hypothetical protein
MAEGTETTTQPGRPQKPVLTNGLKLVSESVAPGMSLALNGRVAAGLAHFAGARLARAVLGPVGWLLVAANSYSLSSQGKSLVTEVSEVRGRRKAAE